MAIEGLQDSLASRVVLELWRHATARATSFSRPGRRPISSVLQSAETYGRSEEWASPSAIRMRSISDATRTGALAICSSSAPRERSR